MHGALYVHTRPAEIICSKGHYDRKTPRFKLPDLNPLLPPDLIHLLCKPQWTPKGSSLNGVHTAGKKDHSYHLASSSSTFLLARVCLEKSFSFD